jgi:hypothetical protein
MADGRMLKKKISLNEAVADLENDTHRLLFTWGIAHLDVEGRITGNLRGFKGLVAPLLEHISQEMVLAFFQDAESHGLIQRYQVDGEWHVQYPKFGNNQKLTKSREAASKRPPPPDAPEKPLNEDSVSSQRGPKEDATSTPPEVKLREVKGREVNKQASACVLGEADDLPSTSSASQVKPSDLLKLWNEMGCRPMVSELTEERRKKAGLRLRKRGDRDWWERLFKKVKVLNKPWLTFDFLMRSDTNSLKVLEGNYDHDFGSRNNGGRRQAGPGAYQKPHPADHGKFASRSRILTTDPGGGGTDPEKDSPGQGGVPGAPERPAV